MFVLIIEIIVIGVLLYLVNTYVPMAGPIKVVLNVVVMLLVIIWLLTIFGVASYLGGGIPRLHH